MFYTAKKKNGPDIQMAPLIDIVFLLLIFFMVSTVFPENVGVDVEKPDAATAVPLPKEHLLFAITRQGNYYYGGKEASLEEIAAVIKAETAQNPGIAVIAEVDRQAVTGDLIRFLDEARKAGGRNISIATSDEESR